MNCWASKKKLKLLLKLQKKNPLTMALRTHLSSLQMLFLFVVLLQV